jgi:hypothetical protein
MTDHLNNSPTAPRTEELVATIQGLLATWESAEQSVRLDRDQIGRLASSVSLGMHAHRVAAAVMACYRAGLWVEAIPLARSCYETALRCQWLRAIEDADLSLFAEHDRQAIDLLRSMVDGRWITDSEDISEIARREAERATRSDASGSPSVFQMCMDLREAGHSAYALYRALSSYSHPGVTVVDLHNGRDVDGEWSGCFIQETTTARGGADGAVARLRLPGLGWASNRRLRQFAPASSTTADDRLVARNPRTPHHQRRRVATSSQSKVPMTSVESPAFSWGAAANC